MEKKVLRFKKGDIAFFQWNNNLVTILEECKNASHDFDYVIKTDDGLELGARDNELEPYIPLTKDIKGVFEKMATELGALVDSKQTAYGNAVETTQKVLEVFMERYKTADGYLIPNDLLPHLFLQVRIIDKQCRIFSNPSGDLMGESPYQDIGGYSLLGKEMSDKKHE